MTEFNADTPADTGGEDWFIEWQQEHRLSPEKARQMLRTTFAQRVESNRQRGDTRPWVVPFTYTHEDDPVEEFEIRGGLWIPQESVQQLVNYAGYFIHYVLQEDLEHATMLTGLKVIPSGWTRMDLTTEPPQINMV